MIRVGVEGCFVDGTGVDIEAAALPARSRKSWHLSSQELQNIFFESRADVSNMVATIDLCRHLNLGIIAQLHLFIEISTILR